MLLSAILMISHSFGFREYSFGPDIVTVMMFFIFIIIEEGKENTLSFSSYSITGDFFFSHRKSINSL